MYYIVEKTISEIEISRSKFISILVPITSTNDVIGIIDVIKKEYPKANHYCYAYIIDNYMKYSDDGEPNQTAGKPMLGVLLSKKMNNVLVVVVRYFGGIKLGAGGLVRAYVNSVSNVLDKSQLYEKKLLDVVSLSVPYNYNKELFYYLEKNSYIIKNKEFDDRIHVIVSKENINIDEIKMFFNGNIIIKYLNKEEILVKTDSYEEWYEKEY